MRLPFDKSARFVVSHPSGVLADRFYQQGEILPVDIFPSWRSLEGLWQQRRIDVATGEQQRIVDDYDQNEPDLPGEEEEDAVVSNGSEQTQQLRASKRRRAA